VDELLMGFIAAGSLFAGLFFYKFWHLTRDRFFLYFAWSFWIEAVNRVALALFEESETSPVFYGIRLVAYGLIIMAIWHKNRPRA
jgi:hypothetical protein